MTVATVAATPAAKMTTTTTTASAVPGVDDGIMSWSSSCNLATRVDTKQDSLKRDEDENSSSVCWEQITIQSKEPSDNDDIDDDDDASFSVLSLPAGGSVGSSSAASGVIMMSGPKQQKPSVLPPKCMSSPNLTCKTPSVVLVDHTDVDNDDDDDDLTVQTMMSADSHVVVSSPQPNSPPPKVVVPSLAPSVWGGGAGKKVGGAWGATAKGSSFRDVILKSPASTPALPVTVAPPAPRRRVPFRPKIVVQQAPPPKQQQPMLRRRNSKSLNDLGAASATLDKNGKVPTILEEEDDYDDYDCDEAYYGQKSMGASSHRIGRRERPDEAKRRMNSMAKRDVQRQQQQCGGGRRRK